MLREVHVNTTTGPKKKTDGKNRCAGVYSPDVTGLVSGAAGGVRPGLVNRRITVQAPHARRICEAFGRDVKVHRVGLSRAAHGGGGKRGNVVMLSRPAKRRMMHTFRNSERLPVMLTLTYPGEFPCDGREVKRHWANMRAWLVRTMGRKGGWFLEFQRRGAPHFHVFLDGEVDFELIARRWYEVVGSKDLRHLVAGTRIEMLREGHAAAAYAAKYAAKVEQKEPPEGFANVGRFWGTFGGLAVEPVATAESSERLICETATGEILPDPVYAAVRVARRLANARRRAAGLPPVRDKGRYGLTLYDVGPALVAYMRRVGLADSATEET